MWQAERFVRTGRSNENGLKTIIARADAGDVIWFMAMANRIGDILHLEGDLDTADVRRSKAVGILGQPAVALDMLLRHQHDSDAHGQTEPDETEPDETEPDDTIPEPNPPFPEPNPPFPEPVEGHTDQPSEPESPGRFDKLSERHTRLGEHALRAARPQVTIHFHLSQEAVAAGTGVVRMEGVAPIPLDQLRRFLTRTGCEVTIRPIVDLNDQPAPVDSYEIPNRLKEYMRHRTPASVFPYSPNTSRRRDLDHTIPYLPPSRGGQPGQTSVGNLGPLTRTEHRHKTFGRWRLRQPEPGTHLWRSPHGHIFLVTDLGTHDLGKTGFAKAIWRAASEASRYAPAA
jgi:hypothetical protein